MALLSICIILSVIWSVKVFGFALPLGGRNVDNELSNLTLLCCRDTYCMPCYFFPYRESLVKILFICPLCVSTIHFGLWPFFVTFSSLVVLLYLWFALRSLWLV